MENPQGNARSRRTKVALLWILFVLAVAGTYLLSKKVEGIDGSASAYLSTGRSTEIDLYEGKASPTSVSVSPGDEIVFFVKDDSHHDIAEERTDPRQVRLESGEIGKDESYSLVFEKSGSHSFYDRMNQDIQVQVTIR
ncbi:MAG: hypothetical protein KGI79_02430 [Patescibacteria group bacterium]|nr:hypothetical protein [Patescibacteria group bacterium]MDE2116709.1 hypothetical protein [Patescibacteria group bacterium]